MPDNLKNQNRLLIQIVKLDILIATINAMLSQRSNQLGRIYIWPIQM